MRRQYKLILNIVILALSLGAVVWLLYLLSKNPLYTSRMGVVLLGMIPAILATNRAFAIIQEISRGSSFRWWSFRIMKWIATPLAFIFLIGVVDSIAFHAGKSVLEKDLGAVIDYMEKHDGSEITAQAILSRVKDAQGVRFFSCAVSGHDYLLTIPISSYDIDGYIFFYDSELATWKTCHRDMLPPGNKDPDKAKSPEARLYTKAKGRINRPLWTFKRGREGNWELKKEKKLSLK